MEMHNILELMQDAMWHNISKWQNQKKKKTIETSAKASTKL